MKKIIAFLPIIGLIFYCCDTDVENYINSFDILTIPFWCFYQFLFAGLTIISIFALVICYYIKESINL